MRNKGATLCLSLLLLIFVRAKANAFGVEAWASELFAEEVCVCVFAFVCECTCLRPCITRQGCLCLSAFDDCKCQFTLTFPCVFMCTGICARQHRDTCACKNRHKHTYTQMTRTNINTCITIRISQVVRGGPAFAVSLNISGIEPTLRSAAELGAWQVCEHYKLMHCSFVICCV